MALRLTLTGGSAGREARTLSSGTLSIGRGERNDWVLADPARTLSKTHCVISVENGQHVLTDLSTNGMHVNGARTPTSRDSRTTLTDGDSIRLGEYSITIAEVADAPHTPGMAGGPLDMDPLADPLGHAPDQAFSHPVHHAPSTARAIDPFDLPDEPGRRTPPGQDLFAGTTPRQEWRGPSQPDHADAPRLAVQMPRVVAPQPNPSAMDFDALIGDLSHLQPGRPVPAAPPRGADPFAGLDAAPAAPPAFVPASAPHPPLPVLYEPPDNPFAEPGRPPAPAPAAATPDAALRAFLDGAGVPAAAMGDDSEAALRAIGQVFRALTEGVREVLMSRAALKGELRVEQTLLKPANNNALKFSFSPDDAVAALLSTGRPGYMHPLDAAKEAFDDIKMHEIAVVAGMQTALQALMDRFDPDTLETRVAKGTLGNMVPAARKARLWDSFRELHAAMKAEAADDFQAIFGRSFTKAYKAQVRKD